MFPEDRDELWLQENISEDLETHGMDDRVVDRRLLQSQTRSNEHSRDSLERRHGRMNKQHPIHHCNKLVKVRVVIDLFLIVVIPPFHVR